MSAGDAGWLALGLSALALAAAAVLGAGGQRRTIPPLRIASFMLDSWAGRSVLLGLWAEAGYHLLCQRP